MDKKTKAKAVKVESLYPGQLKQYGYVLKGFCPFHPDKKIPNFTIYTKTNSWYCFRHKEGGDVISFIMRLKDWDFKTALDYLYYL